MTNLLVMLAWGLLAFFVLDRGDLLRLVSSVVDFWKQNQEAVCITLAVLAAVTVVGRAPQFRGR